MAGPGIGHYGGRGNSPSSHENDLFLDLSRRGPIGYFSCVALQLALATWVLVEILLFYRYAFSFYVITYHRDGMKGRCAHTGEKKRGLTSRIKIG